MGSPSTSWNWDDYKTIGSYKVQTGTSITNHPTYSGTAQAYPYGIAYVIRGLASDGENRTLQMYFPHVWGSFGNIPLYIRMSNSGNWTNWAKIPSTDYVTNTITSALGSYYTKTDSDTRYVKKSGDTMTGNLTAPAFYASSDINLKTNIQEIFNSDKMPIIKEFDWKEDGSHSYGLIAQELEE